MAGIKVTLRTKKIKSGRKSLYLDFYPPILNTETGKETRREFLKLYVLEKPKTPIEKNSNEETWNIAKTIRSKRENQLNKPEIYTEQEKEQIRIKKLGNQSFIDFFEGLMNKRKGTNYQSWYSVLKYLKEFSPELTFFNLTEQTCNDFKEYLLNIENISHNTAAGYFNKFKAALREAFRAGYLQTNINDKIKSIPTEETHREFLTVNELNKLIETPCQNQMLKNAALFSALTGLRFIDIKNLKWKQVEQFEDGYYIRFTQQKTKGTEYHPVSEDAYRIMGTPGDPEDKVFTGLKYSAYHNKHLYQWIGAAGIKKDITFHCFRHTFAVLQLANGTDIYTVSKLMGHRDLKTTQIYAKIVDNLKREAADKIKLNL
ncbi:MAG: site-specific integrase [Bacteroidales bacterium]